jgi:RNA polymerase sigma-70 factor (ECF subfamily)
MRTNTYREEVEVMIEEKKDIELVNAFRGGDEASFVELLGRYTEKVHNLAMRITRNEQDAEEILQDVFITVHEKINTFQGKSAFSSWLYRITANTAFMKLRQRKKHMAVCIDDVPNVNSGSCWYGSRSDMSDMNYMSSRHELRAMLQEAIETLPTEYRMIFILRDVDGLSNQEVGEVLDLSVPAVKSRLHRSRLMLRRKLQRFYDDYKSSDQIFYGMNPYARGGDLAMAA